MYKVTLYFFLHQDMKWIAKYTLSNVNKDEITQKLAHSQDFSNKDYKSFSYKFDCFKDDQLIGTIFTYNQFLFI